MNYNLLRERLDKIGATASLLCAVHCIAMPVLLVILPLIGLSFLLDETFEKVFIGLSVALAVFNTCWGYKVHKKHRVILLSLIGSLLLLFVTFILGHGHPHEFHDHSHHSHHHAHHEEVSRMQSSTINLSLLVIGALLIAGGHFLNQYFCRKCTDCNHNHD